MQLLKAYAPNSASQLAWQDAGKVPTRKEVNKSDSSGRQSERLVKTQNGMKVALDSIETKHHSFPRGTVFAPLSALDKREKIDAGLIDPRNPHDPKASKGVVLEPSSRYIGFRLPEVNPLPGQQATASRESIRNRWIPILPDLSMYQGMPWKGLNEGISGTDFNYASRSVMTFKNGPVVDQKTGRILATPPSEEQNPNFFYGSPNLGSRPALPTRKIGQGEMQVMHPNGDISALSRDVDNRPGARQIGNFGSSYFLLMDRTENNVFINP